MGAAVDVVVFDLGEVLSVQPSHLAELAAILDAPGPEFTAAYWRHRRDYDLGGEAAAYWTAVAADLQLPLDAAHCDELTRTDCFAWTTLHPGSEPLLRDVAATGVRLALLSNAPLPIAAEVRAAPWSTLLQPLFFSCDLRLGKPDPALYAEVTRTLEVQPARIVFFDDRPDNVAGARDAGWRAELWSGHRDARQLLAELGVTPGG